MTGGIGTRPATTSIDLRRAPLADLRNLDLRASTRDFWADEAALWDRQLAVWAGLDEAAWHLPGAAPSDAGGPDWSMAEHVGHLADWQELAIDYIGTALQTGRWPSDDDYDGGDFDRFNERRRAPWTTMPRTAILARLGAARLRLLEAAHRLTLEQFAWRRRLGLGLHDPSWPLSRSPHDHRAVGRSTSRSAGRRRSIHRRSAAGRPCRAVADDRREIDALFDELVRTLPMDRWRQAR